MEGILIWQVVARTDTKERPVQALAIAVYIVDLRACLVPTADHGALSALRRSPENGHTKFERRRGPFRLSPVTTCMSPRMGYLPAASSLRRSVTPQPVFW